MRVLVVEDEEALGGVFRDFLLELGHQPLIVRSAEAALGKLKTERPDAIILDIHLPGMSGLDFLQLRPIRESGVPIVAVSGVATESQARECLRLGALDFVGKPVPLDRLDEVLTFLEPHARDRRSDDVAPPPNRRQAPRARIALPVHATEYGGVEWRGTTVEFSPFGMKIRVDRAIRPSSAAKLSFTPPDGGPALTVMALVIREDPDGVVFSFVNLTGDDFKRVSDAVHRHGVG